MMALKQHLGDAGSAAEVAIDLERRMGAKQVGIGASTMDAVVQDGRLQQLLQKKIGVVAIAQSCPETDLPSP